MVGCSNKEEKDIDELNKTIDELVTSNNEKDKEIAELKDKEYKYDSLQQLYLTIEDGMKLDEVGELVRQYEDVDTTITGDDIDRLEADDRALRAQIGFTRYMNEKDEGEFGKIKYIVNGDYVEFLITRDNVGQLKVSDISYHNYSKDVWCQKRTEGTLGMPVCDTDYVNMWLYKNSTEEQINYIIDK